MATPSATPTPAPTPTPTATPIPTATPPPDHFLCYKVGTQAGAAWFLGTDTSVANQFRSVPVAIAVVDVNGDGNFDLVTANDISDDVSVLLGRGNGLFQTATYFPAGISPTSVAVADVDGDDVPDIVTANDSDVVNVLLGNGDGTFQEPVPFATGDGPRSVAVADVDGDDNPDVVTANDFSDDVSVLLGNGDGTFQAPVSFAAGDGPAAVVVADLDGDDIPDLVTANRDGNNVGVLLGNGDGTFQAPVFFAAGSAPVSVAVADLDDDSVPDVVSANRDSNNVSVLLGNGDGTFQAAVFYRAGRAPVSVAVANLFGEIILQEADSTTDPPTLEITEPDLFPDIVTANRDSNNVSVLLGKGDGIFRAALPHEAGVGPVSLAVANLDGDFRNSKPPQTPTPRPPPVRIPIPDLLTANSGGFDVTRMRGRPSRNDDRFFPPFDFAVVARDVHAYKVRQFCTAVDKNGEGITNPNAHLTCYEIRRMRATQPQVTTTDQFGELALDVGRQRSQVCAPTALISIEDQVINAPTPLIDFYELFKIRETRGSDRFEKREVSVKDLFMDETVLLKKPVRLGAPMKLARNDVRNPFHHLNCYKLKAPRFRKVNIRASNSTFGALDLKLRRPNMLCTPSEKEVVPDDS